MNIIKDRFYKGLNLGGWFSQCKEYSQDHYHNFMSEEDIVKIKALGFDHVRVPFDYHLIMESESASDYLESGFRHLDRAVEWCRRHQLNVILDLHKAPGYSFDTKTANQLFEDPILQNKIVDIWTTITRHYKNVCGDEVMFELLNEIVEPDNSRWIPLATRLIDEMSAIDPKRYIMIGGNNYNSCGDLKYLPLFEDKRVVYTFHFYEPILFTHQKAYWYDRAMRYNQDLVYPGEYLNVDEFVATSPKDADLEDLEKEGLNKEAIRKYMTPAFEFIARTGQPLYCGEYGAIALADLDSRVNWHRDVMSLFDEYEIGSGCWSYKEMDFELIDDGGRPLSDELMRILARR